MCTATASGASWRATPCFRAMWCPSFAQVGVLWPLVCLAVGVCWLRALTKTMHGAFACPPAISKLRLPSCHLCSLPHVAKKVCCPTWPADGDDDLVLQADMLLLAGTCIVDESVLTGGWAWVAGWAGGLVGGGSGDLWMGGSGRVCTSMALSCNAQHLVGRPCRYSPAQCRSACLGSQMAVCRREHAAVEEPSGGGHR